MCYSVMLEVVKGAGAARADALCATDAGSCAPCAGSAEERALCATLNAGGRGGCC